jgi:hypothetical protein
MKDKEIKNLGIFIGYNALILSFFYFIYSLVIFKVINLIITSFIIMIITILSLLGMKVDNKYKSLISVINASLTTMLIMYNILFNLGLI